MRIHFVIHGEFFHNYFLQCLLETFNVLSVDGDSFSYSFHAPLTPERLGQALCLNTETLLGGRTDVDVIVVVNGKNVWPIDKFKEMLYSDHDVAYVGSLLELSKIKFDAANAATAELDYSSYMFLEDEAVHFDDLEQAAIVAPLQ